MHIGNIRAPAKFLQPHSIQMIPLAAKPLLTHTLSHTLTAQDHYEQAKKLVHETGYHRRDKELEELRVKLDQV